jgi:LytS/YehU family sensor histidine kinase
MDQMFELFTLLLGLGVLGYLLAVTVHYVLQASEESARSERRALESQVAQREAELRALRAQIDPHFLFNSLNSIVGLMAADAGQARLMTLRLAEFLRDSLTLGAEPRISLGREAALADQYLGVERVRFGSRLTVTAAIAADASSVPVPPLIIQPLVENAVRHGISPKVGGGVVRIEAFRDGGTLRVVVRDNGSGFKESGREGIGLRNVRERLRVAYGNRASIEISSEPERGTSVILSMPVERGQGGA